MRTPLCDLADKYGTNKGELGYTQHYWEILGGIPTPKRILELGIGGPGLSGGPSEWGASLYMWQEFFPDAEIFAIDHLRELLINEGHITSFQADIYDPSTLVRVAEIVDGRFDLIVDDAVHDPMPQITAYVTLRPYLTPDGVYVIEDVCAEKFPHNDPTWLATQPDPGPSRYKVYGEGNQTLIALYPQPHEHSYRSNTRNQISCIGCNEKWNPIF